MSSVRKCDSRKNSTGKTSRSHQVPRVADAGRITASRLRTPLPSVTTPTGQTSARRHAAARARAPSRQRRQDLLHDAVEAVADPVAAAERHAGHARGVELRADGVLVVLAAEAEHLRPGDPRDLRRDRVGDRCSPRRPNHSPTWNSKLASAAGPSSTTTGTRACRSAGRRLKTKGRTSAPNE